MMCHLTAVWLLYKQPYDLVDKGRDLFDLLEASFLADEVVRKRRPKSKPEPRVRRRGR